MTATETINTLDAYIGRGFHEIQGWLYMPAVEATLALGHIQRSVMRPGPVCEIGVWEGRYLTLLSFVPEAPQRVLGVDPFIHSADRHAQLARVRQNLDQYSRRPDLVSLLERDSKAVTPVDILTATGAPCQFVSVDGDHTLEGCLSDMRLAQGVLAPGGIVSVDDIANMTCPGVVEGVMRYAMEPEATLVPFLIVSNKLFLAHKGFADYYRDAVIGRCGAGQRGEWGRQVAAYDRQMKTMGIPVRFLGEDLLVQP